MLAQRFSRSSAGLLIRRAAPSLRQSRSLCTGDAVGDALADNTKAGTFTGTPSSQLTSRSVKIFQPSQGVQNGTQNTLIWKMQWDDGQTKRWTNPLMGWSSTSDPMSNTHMTMEFLTAEDAVRFAEENGEKPCVPSSDRVVDPWRSTLLLLDPPAPPPQPLQAGSAW
jgi:hypothetical protein